MRTTTSTVGSRRTTCLVHGSCWTGDGPWQQTMRWNPSGLGQLLRTPPPSDEGGAGARRGSRQEARCTVEAARCGESLRSGSGVLPAAFRRSTPEPMALRLSRPAHADPNGYLRCAPLARDRPPRAAATRPFPYDDPGVLGLSLIHISEPTRPY